jgi:PAS domain S-box-containing protein
MPAMENDIRQYLKKLDPRNFKLTVKILMLVIALVVVVILTFFTLGLKTLHKSLLSINSVQLEELNYLKSSEIEISVKSLSEQLLKISTSSEIQSAAEEFTGTFNLLGDESEVILGSITLKEASQKLTEYYNQELVKNAPLSGEKLMDFLPSDEKTILAQYIYMVNNNQPYGQKEKFIKQADDNSSYGSSHNIYHNKLWKLRDLLNASDLYLVDPNSGYIVYSVAKNPDFGSNLLDSKLKDSRLSEAFRKALASSKPEILFTDYSSYPPAGDNPAAFISIPVYSGSDLITILILQYPTGLFDSMLSKEYMNAGNSSLEYCIIGFDLKLRNDPKKFLFDKENCLKRMIRKANRREFSQVLNYQKTGHMALLTGYSKEYKNSILKEGPTELVDYFGNNVVVYSRKIDVLGMPYYLQTKIDKTEVLSPFRGKRRAFFITALILLTLVILVSRFFGKTLTSRIQKLFDAMVLLHNGEKSKAIEKAREDEVGDVIETFNKLRKRINNAEEFALEMSEGNYNYIFEILSERDSLGKSLNVLKEKLILSRDEHVERAREDEIRNWINTGVAKFNDLLRQNNADINLLAYSIIENLTQYVGANIGGIFLVEGEKESEKYIELAASYAYDRRKYHQKKVEVKEGLLGACYLEKKSILLKQIPEDYIEITSGLGHQVPTSLYIVPLKVDDDVLGLMEIASNSDFEKHHIEFIDQVSNSIAATFVSVRLNMKTTTLLDESNRRAEEITQQEEEMRQNLEEMQATQEELARLRQDDEKHRREMQLIIDNTRLMLRNVVDVIPGGFILKDQNGIIHMINAEGSDIYGQPADRILGKTDHELLGVKAFESEHKIDLDVIENGEQQYTEEREIKGQKRKFKVIKKPFNIKEIGQVGIFTMRFDIKE